MAKNYPTIENTIFGMERGLDKNAPPWINLKKMDQEQILPLIQLADILAHKDFVSPILFKTFIGLLSTLHKELILKWRENPEDRTLASVAPEGSA